MILRADQDFVQVLEHDKLFFQKNDFRRDALMRLAERREESYFRPIVNGVKFFEYVGILQIDGLTIEVLPKIDAVGKDGANWQSVLIDMLYTVGFLKTRSPGMADVGHRQLSLQDHHLHSFLEEVEALLKKGLIRKYRLCKGQVTSMRGKMNFSQQMKKNLVRADRFYTQHREFDFDHVLNQILGKALHVLRLRAGHSEICRRIDKILLNFPEVKDIFVDGNIFSSIRLDRKSEKYRPSINYAQMVLLQYFPDVKRGENREVAIMFDMNALWEQYIYRVLKLHKSDKFRVHSQWSKNFWQEERRQKTSKQKRPRSMKPDIVLEPKDKSKGQKAIVIDTKWKLPKNLKPAINDLKQMYLYNEYYDASDSILLYPGLKSDILQGSFISPGGGRCHVMTVSVLKDGQTGLSDQVAQRILDLISST